MSSDAKKMTKDFRREKKQLDEEKNKLILNLRIVSDSVSAFISKKPNQFRKSYFLAPHWKDAASGIRCTEKWLFSSSNGNVTSHKMLKML